MVSNIAHELSHKNDFKEIAMNDNICFLTIPAGSNNNSMAWYYFEYKTEDQFKETALEQRTEFKASLLKEITFFILALIIVYVGYKTIKRKGDGKNVKTNSKGCFVR